MRYPTDPVNLQRALWVLRDLSLIEIRDSKPINVTELDVIKNPGGIKIVPLEAAQAPRALDDVDFAAVQGNFAIYSGLKLTNAFGLEKMTTPYINVVAVKRPMQEPMGPGYRRRLQIADLQGSHSLRPVLRRLHAAGLSQVSP